LRVAHRLVRCIPDEKHFDCLKAAGLMVRCVLGARRGGIGRDPFPAAWSRAQGSSEQAIVVRGHRWLWADGLPSRHSHWGCDSRNIQHSGQDWSRDFRPDCLVRRWADERQTRHSDSDSDNRNSQRGGQNSRGDFPRGSQGRRWAGGSCRHRWDWGCDSRNSRCYVPGSSRDFPPD
jgi:hypothetical protein